MTTFFAGCSTMDALKKAFHILAQSAHPDHGGNTATMQAINEEYKARFEVLKRGQNERAAQDTSGYTQATTETAEEFVEIIEKLLRMDGITVELCGRWLWIGGNTKEHKDALKAAGCRWCSKKKLWSWHHEEDGVKRSKRNIPMDEIREKYGSKVYGSSRTPHRIAAEGRARE